MSHHRYRASQMVMEGGWNLVSHDHDHDCNDWSDRDLHLRRLLVVCKKKNENKEYNYMCIYKSIDDTNIFATELWHVANPVPWKW